MSRNPHILPMRRPHVFVPGRRRRNDRYSRQIMVVLEQEIAEMCADENAIASDSTLTDGDMPSNVLQFPQGHGRHQASSPGVRGSIPRPATSNHGEDDGQDPAA